MNKVVLMPYYNGEKYFKEQIESILNQTVEVDKVVVCNDNPDDKNWKAVSKKFAHEKIMFISNKKNLGVNRTVKKLIDTYSEKSEIIFISDQDDIWDKDKVKKQTEILEKHDICTHNSNFFYEKDGLKRLLSKKDNKKSGSVTGFNHKLSGRTMAFRSSLGKKMKSLKFNYFKKDSSLFYDNYIALFSMVNNERQYFLSDCLDNHRLHLNNISKDVSKEFNSSYKFFNELRNRIVILKKEFNYNSVRQGVDDLTVNRRPLATILFTILFYLPFFGKILKLHKKRNPFYIGETKRGGK